MKQASIYLVVCTWVCTWTLGCAADARESAGPTRLISFSNEADTPAVLEVEGVRIEVIPPTSEQLSALTQESEGATESTTRINMELVKSPEPSGKGTWIWLSGQPLSVTNGVLRIGATSYGPAKTPDSVRVDATGVHINGELRGELPRH